jgi:hypothetical protein
VSKRIAPMLHHHVSMPCTKTYFTLEDMKQGQAELRALLAVARAARKLETQNREWLNGKIIFNADVAVNALGDALARLDRVSGSGAHGTGGAAP